MLLTIMKRGVKGYPTMLKYLQIKIMFMALTMRRMILKFENLERERVAGRSPMTWGSTFGLFQSYLLKMVYMLHRCLYHVLGLTRTSVKSDSKRLDTTTEPITKDLGLLEPLRYMISQVMRRMRGGTVAWELKKTKPLKDRHKK